MSRKAAELPDIEDTAFAACLAPLSDGLPRLPETSSDDFCRATLTQDLAPPSAGERCFSVPGTRPEAPPPLNLEDTEAIPLNLAEWRSVADQEYAEFRVIQSFLAKTDAELMAAAQAYPRQILGLLARVSRLQLRRAAQHETAALLVGRLHAAMLKADSVIAPPGR